MRGRSRNRCAVPFVYWWAPASHSLFPVIGNRHLLSRLRRHQGGACSIGGTFAAFGVVSSVGSVCSDYCRWIYDNTGSAQVRYSMDTWVEIPFMVLIWCSYFNRLQFPHKKYASAGMGDYNVKMQVVTADKICLWAERMCIAGRIQKGGRGYE